MSGSISIQRGRFIDSSAYVENFAICKNLWIHFAIHGSKPYNVKNKAKVWKDRTAIAQVKSNSGNRAAPHAHGHVRDGTQVSRISHTPSFHGAFNVKQSSAFVGSKQVQLDLTWFWCFFFKSKFYGHSSLFGECFGCCGVQEGGGKNIMACYRKVAMVKTKCPCFGVEPSNLHSHWDTAIQTWVQDTSLSHPGVDGERIAVGMFISLVLLDWDTLIAKLERDHITQAAVRSIFFCCCGAFWTATASGSWIVMSLSGTLRKSRSTLEFLCSKLCPKTTLQSATAHLSSNPLYKLRSER